jgi:hypothetical protein
LKIKLYRVIYWGDGTKENGLDEKERVGLRREVIDAYKV